MTFCLYNKSTTTKDVVDERREKVTNLYRFKQKERENRSIINQRQRNDVDDEKENQLQIFTDLNEKKRENRSIINLRTKTMMKIKVVR